jgi:membrane glycosyltransferase
MTRRASGFGGAIRATGSVLAEIALTSLLAPVMMVYQTRAILQVLSGQDGGWPANARAEGELSLAAAAGAALWVSLIGAAVMGVVWYLSPALLPWILPVALPMFAAPALIALSSRGYDGPLFTVPDRQHLPQVYLTYRSIHDGWTGEPSKHGSASHVAA